MLPTASACRAASACPSSFSDPGVDPSAQWTDGLWRLFVRARVYSTKDANDRPRICVSTAYGVAALLTSGRALSSDASRRSYVDWIGFVFGIGYSAIEGVGALNVTSEDVTREHRQNVCYNVCHGTYKCSGHPEQFLYLYAQGIRSGMRGYDTVLTGICVFYLSSTMYQSYAAAHEV